MDTADSPFDDYRLPPATAEEPETLNVLRPARASSHQARAEDMSGDCMREETKVHAAEGCHRNDKLYKTSMGFDFPSRALAMGAPVARTSKCL